MLGIFLGPDLTILLKSIAGLDISGEVPWHCGVQDPGKSSPACMGLDVDIVESVGDISGTGLGPHSCI